MVPPAPGFSGAGVEPICDRGNQASMGSLSIKCSALRPYVHLFQKLLVRALWTPRCNRSSWRVFSDRIGRFCVRFDGTLSTAGRSENHGIHQGARFRSGRFHDPVGWRVSAQSGNGEVRGGESFDIEAVLAKI